MINGYGIQSVEYEIKKADRFPSTSGVIKLQVKETADEYWQGWWDSVIGAMKIPTSYTAYKRKVTLTVEAEGCFPMDMTKSVSTDGMSILLTSDRIKVTKVDIEKCF